MKEPGKWIMLVVMWIVTSGLSYAALDKTGSPWVLTFMVIPFFVSLNNQNRR